MKHTLKHKTYGLLLAALLPLAAGAQGGMRLTPRYRAALQEIVRNNTTLKAAGKQTEAQRLQLRSSLRLPDPEAEVAYLVGSPKGVPNRTNVTVTQALDWGVLTGRKKREADAGSELLALRQTAETNRVAAEADRALVEMVYRNKLLAETRRRNANAQELLALCEKRYERGDISLPEVNKARLNASMERAAEQRAEAGRKEAAAELARLNGGRAVEYPDTLYGFTADALPTLAELLAQAPAANAEALADGAVRQSRAEAEAAKAEAWPELTAGFMGEYIKNNNYSGLSVGFTLPLWGNGRRKARQKEAETLARQLEADDTRLQLRAALAQQHQTAAALFRTQAELRESLGQTDNTALLRRALDEGEISLITYLTELSFRNEAIAAQLETERDTQAALAALRALLR